MRWRNAQVLLCQPLVLASVVLGLWQNVKRQWSVVVAGQILGERDHDSYDGNTTDQDKTGCSKYHDKHLGRMGQNDFSNCFGGSIALTNSGAY